MKRRNSLILTALSALFVLLPVALYAKMKVEVFYAKVADFSSYKTYQWLPTKAMGSSGIVENEEYFTPLIKAAIDRQLAAKGLKQVPQGGDLQVATLVMKSASPQLEAIIYGWFPTADYIGMVGGPIATVGRYNYEGTFVVNLIDSKTNKSAWAAIARDSLDRAGGSGSKLGKAAEKMFEKYPPKPKT